MQLSFRSKPVEFPAARRSEWRRKKRCFEFSTRRYLINLVIGQLLIEKNDVSATAAAKLPIFVGEAGFPRFLQVGLSAEAVHGFRNCDLDGVCAAAVVGVNAVKDFLELKKKNFRCSASATLLCVYVERRKVSRRGTSGPSRGNGRQTRPLSVPREVSLFFLLGPQQPTRRESPQAREPSSASPRPLDTTANGGGPCGCGLSKHLHLQKRARMKRLNNCRWN